ncbi:MAG: DUF1800 domain-containing protein [Natronohydrobacter sp.]|nr:DUF1800 domain-containing protein [Natronohydrobacter sp.]
MISKPTLAAIRFGAGLSPEYAPPDGAAALWDSLSTEARRKAPPVTLWETRLARAIERRDQRQARRDGDASAQEARRLLNRADRDDALADLRATLVRLATSETGFFERLSRFWSNHFALQAKSGNFRAVRVAYAEDALRPHILSPFADMLKAAILHPAMLDYLDQNRSVGPASRTGRRRGRGLNENLARELLELHTLGVAGGYTQDDVTQMARLLTGLTYTLEDGFTFRPNIAEPGIIEIFGKRYGGRPVTLDHILTALDDLALRPETAQHLATKLAQHFISDAPDPQLVAHMAASYLEAKGDLPALYRAMLEHPAAWVGPLAKTRAPFEMMAASLRALAVDRAMVLGLSRNETRRFLDGPMRLMGERHEAVPSPAGYSDASSAWITPQGLAARIDWAMGLAQLVPGDTDPRDFVEIALADAASEALRRASAGAETRAQGIGLILAAPDFNRR